MVSEISVHHCGRAWQSRTPHIMAARDQRERVEERGERERKKEYENALAGFLLFPIWAPSLWDGAAHIEGGPFPVG
jgi:hypothetical protein